LLGANAEELLEVLAGDQAPSADLDVVEVPASHLVIKQVSGKPSQAGSLADGIGQPLGRQARCRTVFPRWMIPGRAITFSGRRR
jgi:hypothetical protein